HRLLVVDAQQRHFRLLQLAVRLVARAAHRPAGSVAHAIVAEEVDLGIAFGAAPAQYVASVFGQGGVAADVRQLDAARVGAAQARGVAAHRQAPRVEQAALARAGRAADGEQAGRGARFALEVDLEIARHRGEVAP